MATQIIDAERVESERKEIAKTFFAKVYGKSVPGKGANIRHDGRGGHGLEKLMGLRQNCRNQPDFEFFELKCHTRGKITYGDWKGKYIWEDPDFGITRDQFLEIFGRRSPRTGKFSWSGKPVPKIGHYNAFGQILEVQDDKSILALYSFSKDQRADKLNIVPERFRKERLVLVTWECEIMKRRVEDKYNKGGWCKGNKDKNGKYYSISFGEPIDYDSWIEDVKAGKIIFDSGMVQGESRTYSAWRSSNSHWEKRVTRVYHKPESIEGENEISDEAAEFVKKLTSKKSDRGRLKEWKKRAMRWLGDKLSCIVGEDIPKLVVKALIRFNILPLNAGANWDRSRTTEKKIREKLSKPRGKGRKGRGVNVDEVIETANLLAESSVNPSTKYSIEAVVKVLPSKHHLLKNEGRGERECQIGRPRESQLFFDYNPTITCNHVDRAHS
jgi:hypothetical protein